MLIPGRILPLALVMTIFAGNHRIVQVAPYGLLDRVPFGKIVIVITGVAGDASQAFGVMDI